MSDEETKASDKPCKLCNGPVTIDCGYEEAKHGYCYQCASIVLDDAMQTIHAAARMTLWVESGSNPMVAMNQSALWHSVRLLRKEQPTLFTAMEVSPAPQ